MRDSGVGRTPQRGIRMETDTATGQSPGWRRNEVGDDRQVGPGGKPERGEATRERAVAERATVNWAKEKGLGLSQGRKERACWAGLQAKARAFRKMASWAERERKLREGGSRPPASLGL